MISPAAVLPFFVGTEYRQVINATADRYKVPRDDRELQGIIGVSLLGVLQAMGGLSNEGPLGIPLKIDPRLKGKTITDVACGRDEPYPDLNCHPRKHQPWIARVATEMGMQVIGIDKASPPQVEVTNGGSWTYMRTDLTECQPWNIGSSSQDGVLIRGLVHSTHHEEIAPEVWERIIKNPLPGMGEYTLQFRPHLLREARRILRPEGRLLLNNLCYQKTKSGWTASDILTEYLLDSKGLNGVSPERLPMQS